MHPHASKKRASEPFVTGKHVNRSGEGTANFSAALTEADRHQSGPYVGTTTRGDTFVMPRVGSVHQLSFRRSQATVLADRILATSPQRRQSIADSPLYAVSNGSIAGNALPVQLRDGPPGSLLKEPKCRCTSSMENVKKKCGGRARPLPAKEPVIQKKCAQTLSVLGTVTVVGRQISQSEIKWLSAAQVRRDDACVISCLLAGLHLMSLITMHA